MKAFINNETGDYFAWFSEGETAPIQRKYWKFIRDNDLLGKEVEGSISTFNGKAMDEFDSGLYVFIPEGAEESPSHQSQQKENKMTDTVFNSASWNKKAMDEAFELYTEPDYIGSPYDIFEAGWKAKEQFSRIDMIGFPEWCSDNGYAYNGNHTWWSDPHPNAPSPTTDQLLTEYLNSKTKP